MSAGAPEEFGPYTVYEEIGMGGMAAVHRAETRGIEGFRKLVALKRMLPSVAANDDFVEAFIREARIASHLRHVNVAQTFELGKVDGIYFIAMELVTGRNLRQILRHCAQLTGQMPVAVTLNILNQICDALDYAHNLCDSTGTRLGIIHRDVSPSNIIVSEDGVVKLIDFGIAKASAAGMQTMSGMLKGKFGYMAPEYIAGAIDARADLFAVGVIAHELLTNRPLFTTSDDMETLNRVRNMPIRPPSARNPKVPKEIDELVMTALARDPDRRWQHATALRNALTTMTKRLTLDITNTEVVRWIHWVFDQTAPPSGGAAVRGRAPATEPGKRDDFTMAVEQHSTDVDPPEGATVASRTPVTTIHERDLQPTMPRVATPQNVAAAAAAANAVKGGPQRTLLGSAPNIQLASLQQRSRGSDPGIALPPVGRRSEPNVIVKQPTPNPAFDGRGSSAAVSAAEGRRGEIDGAPPRPGRDGFGAGSAPGHVPAGESTKVVAPMPRGSGQTGAQPGAAPRSTGAQPAQGGDSIALVAFLVIVVAAATAVVLYFALT